MLCGCGCLQETKVHTRTYAKYGQIAGEPRRFLAGHQKRRTTPQYIEEDCGYETPCWVWQWAKDPNGYGRINTGTTGDSELAHRYIYKSFRGEIPASLPLDHLCRNPSCVNPDHLEPVTHRTNIHRGRKLKISDEQVLELRAIKGRTLKEMAAQFGITWGYVSEIRGMKRSRADVVGGDSDGQGGREERAG